MFRVVAVPAAVTDNVTQLSPGLQAAAGDRSPPLRAVPDSVGDALGDAARSAALASLPGAVTARVTFDADIRRHVAVWTPPRTGRYLLFVQLLSGSRRRAWWEQRDDAAVLGASGDVDEDPFAPPESFVAAEELQGDAWWAETAGSPFDLEVLPGEPVAAQSDAGGPGTGAATAGFPALVAALVRDQAGNPVPFEPTESPARQRLPHQVPMNLLGIRRWDQPVTVRAAHRGGQQTASAKLLPVSVADRLGLLPAAGNGSEGAARHPNAALDARLASLGLVKAASTDDEAARSADAQRWALGSLALAASMQPAEVLAAVSKLEADTQVGPESESCWEAELLRQSGISQGPWDDAALDACAAAAVRALYGGAFVARRAGLTLVHVSVGGMPVRSSPFEIRVDPGPLEPR